MQKTENEDFTFNFNHVKSEVSTTSGSEAMLVFAANDFDEFM